MRDHLHLDFETRSAVDLKKVGVYAYALDLSTEVWCAGYAFGDESVQLWRMGEPIPADIADHVIAGGKIIAHNANFERTLWWDVLTRRYGWPKPAIEQFDCTMARALAMNLPADLEGAAAALGLGMQKDMAGYRLMLQMCRPRRQDASGITWWDEPEKLERLYAYCLQDVEVERAVDKRVLALRPLEQKIWQLDQRINDRGVKVDRKLCLRARSIIDATTDKLDREMADVTERDVTACSQVKRLGIWLKDRGVPIDGLAKDDLKEWLCRDDLAPAERRALELRQEAARASTAKIEAFLRRANGDGRARGNLQYCGASATGRWAGRGIQLQNLIRPTIKDVSVAIDALMTGDAELVEMLFGPPLTAVANCLRGMIVADEGKDLISADFANIEGRGVAWIAGEQWKLDAFRAYDAKLGPDLYNVMAGEILGKNPDDVEPTERQTFGKVPELACGYQGGVGAFQAMAYTYGVKVPNEQADAIKNAWRQKHPNTVETWRDLEHAALDAVRRPGETITTHKVRFRVVGSFLWLQLPSGRCLCYPYPRITRKQWITVDDLPRAVPLADVPALRDWCARHGKSFAIGGEPDVVVAYKAINGVTKKWEDHYGYGGLWTENVVQALSRDIMAEAMLRVEAAGYPVVLTVHDEIVAEPPEGFGSLEEFNALMTQIPAWAEGFPVVAKGWRGKRYRK